MNASWVHSNSWLRMVGYSAEPQGWYHEINSLLEAADHPKSNSGVGLHSTLQSLPSLTNGLSRYICQVAATKVSELNPSAWSQQRPGASQRPSFHSTGCCSKVLCSHKPECHTFKQQEIWWLLGLRVKKGWRKGEINISKPVATIYWYSSMQSVLHSFPQVILAHLGFKHRSACPKTLLY